MTILEKEVIEAAAALYALLDNREWSPDHDLATENLGRKLTALAIGQSRPHCEQEKPNRAQKRRQT